MTRGRSLTMTMWMCGIATLSAAALTVVGGTSAAAAADDITGAVTSSNGPEAGVWVIAETDDFDTTFRKIVVTDDDGRFLVPDLPAGSYEVWVRGYGLADSVKRGAQPGDNVDLRTEVASNPVEAAQVYPANYWYSLLEVPPASDFPGTGPEGNGVNAAMRTQADWITQLKDGCQLGNKATREMPMLDLTTFDSTFDAWAHRIRAGEPGFMTGTINRMGGPRALGLYADWTDRIRSGAVPPAPPRPQVLESEGFQVHEVGTAEATGAWIEAHETPRCRAGRSRVARRVGSRSAAGPETVRPDMPDRHDDCGGYDAGRD